MPPVFAGLNDHSSLRCSDRPSSPTKVGCKPCGLVIARITVMSRQFRPDHSLLRRSTAWGDCQQSHGAGHDQTRRPRVSDPWQFDVQSSQGGGHHAPSEGRGLTVCGCGHRSVLAKDHRLGLGRSLASRTAVCSFEDRPDVLPTHRTALASQRSGSAVRLQRVSGTRDRHGFGCSMSRRSNCYDDAVVESFFRTFKTP